MLIIIIIGQWRIELGIFNSYKCKTPSKCVHSKFFVNLFLYKLITFILCAIFMSFYLDYCDCFDKALDCLLIFILITDNLQFRYLI